MKEGYSPPLSTYLDVDWSAVLDFCFVFRPLYVLGYIPKDNRVYLGDKELGVVSYSVQLSVLEYQTAIMRKDFDTADKVCMI